MNVTTDPGLPDPPENLIAPEEGNVTYWTQKCLDAIEGERFYADAIRKVIRELLESDTEWAKADKSIEEMGATIAELRNKLAAQSALAPTGGKTPRTDAEGHWHTSEDGFHCVEKRHPDPEKGDWVPINFARTLERELAALTAENAKLVEERDKALRWAEDAARHISNWLEHGRAIYATDVNNYTVKVEPDGRWIIEGLTINCDLREDVDKLKAELAAALHEHELWRELQDKAIWTEASLKQSLSLATDEVAELKGKLAVEADVKAIGFAAIKRAIGVVGEMSWEELAKAVHSRFDYNKTCVHHTDAEREAAVCPVCASAQLSSLQWVSLFSRRPTAEDGNVYEGLYNSAIEFTDGRKVWITRWDQPNFSSGFTATHWRRIDLPTSEPPPAQQAKESVDPLAAVKAHFAKGGRVQYRGEGNSTWSDFDGTDAPFWLNTIEWQIHPDDLTPPRVETCPTCGSADRAVRESVSKANCGPPLFPCQDPWHNAPEQKPSHHLPPWAKDESCLHNPGKLTPKQVGEGYRLLLKSEIESKSCDTWECGMWLDLCDGGKWRDVKCQCTKIRTYRVPLSTPWPDAPQEPQLVPLEDKPKIVTTHNPTPIPIRQFDWSAVREGSEESGPMGWGRTEQLAIDDLLAQEDDAR